MDKSATVVKRKAYFEVATSPGLERGRETAWKKNPMGGSDAGIIWLAAAKG